MPVAAAAQAALRVYLPLVGSALILAVATRPGSHPLLGLIALVPLFSTIYSARPRTALVRGTVWGAAVAGFLLAGLGSPELAALLPRSLAPSVADSAPSWLGSLATFPGVVLLLPLIAGTYCFLGALLTRWIGFSPFVLGVGWIGVELALGACGLPLGLVAATQTDGWLMHKFGAMLGYALVAFAVAYVNAAAAYVLRRLVTAACLARDHFCEPPVADALPLGATRNGFTFVPPDTRPRAPPNPVESA